MNLVSSKLLEEQFFCDLLRRHTTLIAPTLEDINRYRTRDICWFWWII
jgi:hypothetical protein